MKSKSAQSKIRREGLDRTKKNPKKKLHTKTAQDRGQKTQQQAYVKVDKI